MPAKVQLKLLSNSGELLNVANCFAGKISVLRASTASELRPYQRALGGSSGKDNLEILCDGAPFNPDEHTLFGFGEPSPTTGLSVKQFATSRGISELALAARLVSVGLSDIIDKRCAELTLDQEARLRLLAVTADSEKVIVLNDPFENISTKWRERIAELLAEFTATRNALIIIPSLSYRPEVWIANQCIERIEVGQTSQKTVGFGSAGSQSNAQMDEIRNQLRADPRFAGQFARGESRSTTPIAATGIAAGISTHQIAPATTKVFDPSPMATYVGRLVFALIGSSVGGWALFTAVSMYTSHNGPDAKPKTVTATQNGAAVRSPQTQSSDNTQSPATTRREAGKPPAALAAANVPLARSAEELPEFLLDVYPAPIKASILETARGSIDFQSAIEKSTAEQPVRERADSGNLFSLLEAASNSKSGPTATDSGAPGSLPSSEEQAEEIDTSTMTPEDAQREAIRNRFLEAIRASAQRRQAEAEEQTMH